MNCKNCNTPQRTDFNYCPSCGAKAVKHRLTFRNLTYDITERYFNLDNTFIRTIVQLCIRPEVVIDAYINGVRRKYLNPISHLGIALTLSGLLIFIMQKVLTPDIFVEYGGQGMSEELSKKLFDAIFDYQTLLFILYIPVFAIAGYLTFNRKGYFLSEYMIAYIYIMAQWSIVIFPISLITLLVDPSAYMNLAIPMTFLMVFYSLFVMQRIHRFPVGATILRSFVFFLLTLIGYFAIIILFYAFMFLTGIVTLEDFLPKQ
ncbi:DUF3667 domain-containing protein [Muriicola soli]|uniref:DUF3667 domain-containing protein n=1 Tax=Muriicola soli TaxID=2507538 RepID=A0A411EAI7_9FLAO|nr:DUF3667 domain-containing protein [Muriicola soli]QBA64741.1 DUF3667 domain-containing protein [Muriicola soli]